MGFDCTTKASEGITHEVAQQSYILHSVLGGSYVFPTCEAHSGVAKEAVFSIDALPYISCRRLCPISYEACDSCGDLWRSSLPTL